MEEIIKQYMDNLTSMGYDQKWREEVLNSALTGYQRILYNVENGTTKRKRLGVDTYAKRRFQRLCGISEWYRTATEQNELEVD